MSTTVVLRPIAQYKEEWKPKPAGAKCWERCAEQTKVEAEGEPSKAKGMESGLTNALGQDFELGKLKEAGKPSGGVEKWKPPAGNTVTAISVHVYMAVGKPSVEGEKSLAVSTLGGAAKAEYAEAAAAWKTFSLTKAQIEAAVWETTGGLVFSNSVMSTEDIVYDPYVEVTYEEASATVAPLVMMI